MSGDVHFPGIVPGTYGLIEADAIRALIGYVEQRDGLASPPAAEAEQPCWRAYDCNHARCQELRAEQIATDRGESR